MHWGPLFDLIVQNLCMFRVKKTSSQIKIYHTAHYTIQIHCTQHYTYTLHTALHTAPPAQASVVGEGDRIEGGAGQNQGKLEGTCNLPLPSPLFPNLSPSLEVIRDEGLELMANKRKWRVDPGWFGLQDAK